MATSKTRAEWQAQLAYNQKDAIEALANAVGMRDWNGVIKYAKQLQVLDRKFYDSTSPGRSFGRSIYNTPARKKR